MAKTIFELENIIGAKPAVDRLAFKQWLLDYTYYRMDREAPLSPTGWTNYYFATAGSDANDGLSPDRPKATVTGTQVLISSLNKGGNYVFNFRAGDVFTWTNNSEALLISNITGVVIKTFNEGRYARTGVAPYAIFSAWQPVTNVAAVGSGWVSAGTNAYVLGLNVGANRPWWVKYGSGTHYINNVSPTGIFGEANTVAEMLSMTGAFFYNNNLLYVKLHTAQDINEANIHITQNDIAGIVTYDCATTRIDNIVSDGFGIGTGDNGYNILCRVKDRYLAVVSNCGAYYGGNHLLGTLQSNPAESGGISVLFRNHVGLMRYASNGETSFICYAKGGYNEYMIYQNSGCVGTMVSGMASKIARGRAVYAHTDGPSVPPRWGVAMENFTSFDPIMGHSLSTALNDFALTAAVSGGSYNTASGFIINEDSLINVETSINGLSQYNNLVVINPLIKVNITTPALRPIVQQITSANTVGPQKYFINPEVHVHLSSGTSYGIGIFGSFLSNTRENADIYNGFFYYHMEPGVLVTEKYASLAYNFGKTTTGSYHPDWNGAHIRAYNTLFSCFSTGTPLNVVNLHNAAPGTSGIFGGMEGCAFFKFRSGDYAQGNQIFFGHNRSSNFVTLSSGFATGYFPFSTSELVNSNITNYIEYDRRWHARTNKVIGPYDYNGPAVPSGLSLTSNYSDVRGALTGLPLENDVTLQIYRRSERDFTPAILIAQQSSYQALTGFFDSFIKNDANYTYSLVYTDRMGNTSTLNTDILLGGKTFQSINSTGTINRTRDFINGVDNLIGEQSIETTGVYNYVYELITRKIIGMNGKVYHVRTSGVNFSPSFNSHLVPPVIGEGGITP